MKIVVLAGGISTERDVSLCSGRNIYEALKGNGHDVVLVDLFLATGLLLLVPLQRMPRISPM